MFHIFEPSKKGNIVSASCTVSMYWIYPHPGCQSPPELFHFFNRGAPKKSCVSRCYWVEDGGGYIDYKIKVCIQYTLPLCCWVPESPCWSVPILILIMWCLWCMDTRSVRRYMKYTYIYINFLFYLFISMYWCICTQYAKCIIIHWSTLNLHIQIPVPFSSFRTSRPKDGTGRVRASLFGCLFCFMVVVAVAYLY